MTIFSLRELYHFQVLKELELQETCKIILMLKWELHHSYEKYVKYVLSLLMNSILKRSG